MPLQYPFEYRLGPGFGPKPTDTRQPAMWAKGYEAWWSAFSGATFYPHFHPGQDLVAPLGTPIVASEAGTLTKAGWLSSSSGYGVNVTIRPGTRYVHGHMSKVVVAVGQVVKRGQLLGYVGQSGAASGAHSHHGIQIGSRLYWVMRFYPGGDMQNDPRILPVSTRTAVLKGGGINIRSTPDLDVGSTNIYATSRDPSGTSGDGIFRGTLKLGPLNYAFTYFGDVSTDDGVFAKVAGFGKTLYIMKSLVNIT